MKANRGNAPRELVLNAVTIDVEGFVESNQESFPIPDRYVGRAAGDREIECNMDVLLEVLAEVNTKATFFFLGRIASDIPHIVRRTAEAGHEIACHSYAHLRIFRIAPQEFREKLSAAKRDLEDVSGKRVYGFRAPDFSITSASLWALDVLKELGFIYDSSIYPFALHDVYGIKDANPLLHKLPNGLVEFPLSTTTVLGTRMPFGGGGYFRLYPLWLTRTFLAKLNKQGHPGMFYIHPYEVGPVIPKVEPMSRIRRFRHYYNCGKGRARLSKILKAFRFVPAIEILKGHYGEDFA
jgi:polysaccharide deacetylase family protein (PEP-CTERM system associated)